jgi:hypothetical protein
MANCDLQSDLAHHVHDLNSFYDLAGALLQLGMAGRQGADMRQAVLLRALTASRAVVVFDDWQSLSQEAQRDLSSLIQRFPPGVRVIVTCRGPGTSEEVTACRALLPKAMVRTPEGLHSGVAQRLFFVHMERSKYGQNHASHLEFENPYHRSGRCRRLGDPALGSEDMEMLGDLCSARLGLHGRAHPQAVLMLAASAGNSAGGIYQTYNRFRAQQLVDYGADIDPRYGLVGSLSDVEVEVLWPAMCVAHEVLSTRHRTLVAVLMRVGMPG